MDSGYIAEESEEHQHHATYRDLAASALEGCELCSLFEKALISEYCRRHDCSTTEAEEMLPILRFPMGTWAYTVSCVGLDKLCFSSSDDDVTDQ